MTTLVFKSVKIPLPALLIAVLAAGMFIGIVAGIAAVSYGYDKAEKQARIDRAADLVHSITDYCPPPPSL